MKKILVIFFLSCFVYSNAFGFSATAGEDHTKQRLPYFFPLSGSCVAELQSDTPPEKIPPETPPETPAKPIQNPDYAKQLKAAKSRQLELVKFPKKRMGRAVLEGIGHIIYATSSYWIRQDVMKEDWEYQFTWKDQMRRFFYKDGLRFDSNTFEFNWAHAGAGAIYYNYARSNHLSPLTSFLYTFTASYFWEFFVEFKEVISFNDMIFTPMGGLSIGEPFYQLGRFFRSQKPTFLNRILRIASDPILSISDWIDQKKYKGTNQYAFTEDYWHECNIHLGPRFDSLQRNETNTYFNVGMDSQLILIPEYGTEGVVSRGVNKTLFTQLDLSANVGSKGVYEFNLFSKAVFFGYFQQHIRSAKPADLDKESRLNNENDTRVGYSFFLGAATAFDLITQSPEKISGANDNTQPSPYKYLTDKHSIIHLLGPTFDFSLYQKEFTLRLTTDAYVDFALSYSHAYQKYAALYHLGETKITLKNHGYYYAFGVTFASALQLDYRNLQLKSQIKYHYFDSVEGSDRYQKDIPLGNDFDLQDQRLHFDMSVGYRIPRTNIQCTLGYDQLELKGVIENFSQRHRQHRSFFQVKYLF